MKKIVFATHNSNKLSEIKELLSDYFEVVSLTDIGCDEDIPETGKTLAENAEIKARYIYENYHLNCFADDTGLLVKSLDGEPGVYSARYAGPDKNSDDNMNLLLEKLGSQIDRTAYFETVICLIDDGRTKYFSGKAFGEITRTKSGKEGFGYDPIFRPEGLDCTFAELSKKEKNKISHRGKAVRALIEHLKSL